MSLRRLMNGGTTTQQCIQMCIQYIDIVVCAWYNKGNDTCGRGAFGYASPVRDIRMPRTGAARSENIGGLKEMNFGQALEALKQGKKVYRIGWNGVGMWLELQRPDAHSKMTLPYIFIEYPVNPKHHTYPNGSRVPWLASQTDMLSEDWLIKED